jgi:hypothetical protein
MRGRFLLAGLALGVLFGCYSDEESFCQRWAKLSCVRLEECNKAAFENQYGDDRDDCRDDYENTCEQTAETLADLGCEYDPEEGRDCIHELYGNRNTCGNEADDDIHDACDRVVVECG